MRTQSSVKQEVLILTDGMSNCGGNATQEALELQEFADVFGLIIGNSSLRGQDEIASYLSPPIPNHLFAVESIRSLKLLVDAVDGFMNSTGPCVNFIYRN